MSELMHDWREERAGRKQAYAERVYCDVIDSLKAGDEDRCMAVWDYLANERWDIVRKVVQAAINDPAIVPRDSFKHAIIEAAGKIADREAAAAEDAGDL